MKMFSQRILIFKAWGLKMDLRTGIRVHMPMVSVEPHDSPYTIVLKVNFNNLRVSYGICVNKNMNNHEWT